MNDRPSDTAPLSRRAVIGGSLFLGALAAVAVGLLALVVLARDPAGSGAAAAPTPTANPAGYAYAEPRPAPPLELTDQDGRPFALSSLLGHPVLAFFGYTHCPDVCPATVGVVNEALAEVGEGPRAVFTSIDPERDTPEAMKSYLRYLPAAYTGLSGSAQDVRRNADAWGVKYARIDQDSAGGYAMAHTADIFLIDAQGMLRGHFPFGTPAEPIAAALAALLAEPPPAGRAETTPDPSGGTTPSQATPAPATPAPASPVPASPSTAVLYPEVISTSIWAGNEGPVILRATDGAGAVIDGSAPVTVQLRSFDGTDQGDPVTATSVLPIGESQPYLVASLAIPSRGCLEAGRDLGRRERRGLDPGPGSRCHDPDRRARPRCGHPHAGRRRRRDPGRDHTAEPGPAPVADLDGGRAGGGQAVRHRHRFGAFQGLAGVRPGAHHDPLPAGPVAG